MTAKEPPPSKPLGSPIDVMRVPEHLTARVVAPGVNPLLHGYDVQNDLARHYDFGEVALLGLIGTAPTEVEGRAFNLLLTFLAPISIAEAPSHAASLARLCSAKPSSVISVATVGLAEQARFTLDSLEPLIAWLASDRSGPAPSTETNGGANRLHEQLREIGVGVHEADSTLSLLGAVVASLYDLGLRDPWQLEAVWTLARLPAAIAEAMAQVPGDLRSYPIRMPPFEIASP